MISDDYVDLLPELPLDVFKNRLNSAVRRKGKEKATGAVALSNASLLLKQGVEVNEVEALVSKAQEQTRSEVVPSSSVIPEAPVKSPKSN